MGRYEDLMKMINPEIQAQDETTKANNPRNWLADKVNPALDEYINPHLPDSFKLNVPEMTVADQKRYETNLPENMAGAAMGSIKNVEGGLGSRFGNLMQQAEKPQALGKVTVIPSTADEVGRLADLKMDRAGLKPNEISAKVQELFGPELAKRKAGLKTGEVSPEAYNSFKQERFDKVRRGEY
jgi:hypothetical protein